MSQPTDKQQSLCYDEDVLAWREKDYANVGTNTTYSFPLLDNDPALATSWKQNELKALLHLPLKFCWSELHWDSWDGSYTNENSKCNLMTSTIDGNLSKYPRTILFWLDKIVLDISKKLALKVGISFEDLLLIGLNFNVCGNSGLAPHIDLCRNGDFGDFIVNLIITGGGFVVFSESKAKTTACCGVWLGPGDIYLISKSARFNFFHKVITAGAKSRRIARTISGVQKVEFDPKGIRLTLTLRYFYNRDKLQDELFDKDLS